MRRFSLVVGIASILFSIAACRTHQGPDLSQPPGPPAYDDTFVESSIGDASYLNPVLASDSPSSAINGLVFNGLVRYGPDLKLQGDLAERWEITNHGRTITFYLKRNVSWQDGIPFTSQDVLYTYARLKDPKVKTPAASNFELVESVTAPDDHTVRVQYRVPYVPALESWGIGIVPQHIFGDAAGETFNKHPANRAPVGTGPYVFKKWKSDQYILLEANPNYFRGKPKIARYLFRIIPDDSVEFLELRKQSIDTMGLTPDQYHAYSEFFEAYNKFHYPSASYVYLAFNLTNPLFQNQQVRQALARAINKKELVNGVLMGMGSPATGPFLPSSWAYDPSVQDFAYDLQEARNDLEKAGWKDHDGDGILDKDGTPFSFTILTNQGNKMRSLSAEIIQQQLAAVGIRVEIRIVEWSSFINEFINKHRFDAVILGWSLSPDPDMYSIWHSSQRGEGQFNFISYVNAEVDRLLEEGRREFDPGKRQKIYQRLHRIIHDEAPYIFLYYPDALPVIHKRFQGIQLDAISSFGLAWNFEDWYVPQNWVKYPVLKE